LDIEDAFVHAALRARLNPSGMEEVRQLSSAEHFDWEVVKSLTERREVASFVYDTLNGKDIIPGSVIEWFHQAYVDTAGRTLFLLTELENVQEVLRSTGIRVVVLKGASLVGTLYDDIALRPMVDIDLLVDEQDVAVVVKTLVVRGYAHVPVSPLLSTNAVTLRSEGPIACEFDIHWHLFKTPHHQNLISMAWFWDTARELRIGETSALRLAPEAELLYLSAHLAKHGGHSDDLIFRWGYDIAVFLHRHAGSIDWERTLEQARAYQLVQAVNEAVALVDERWGIRIPGFAARALSALEPTMEERNAWAAQESPDKTYHVLRDSIRHRSGFRRLALLTLRAFVPPVSFMKKRYGIKHRILLPFYYPRRWAEGAIRAFSVWLRDGKS
ncbi:MAG: nucleotidyltransferase family protein, partial [Rhodothermales bacterium]